MVGATEGHSSDRPLTNVGKMGINPSVEGAEWTVTIRYERLH
jgi:hypothetical protein